MCRSHNHVFSLSSDPSLTSTGQMRCSLLQIFVSFGKERAPCPYPHLPVPSAGATSWEAYLPPWRQTRGCASGRSRWSGGTSGTWRRSGICWPRRCRNKCPAGYSTWSWQGCPNLAGERKEVSHGCLLASDSSGCNRVRFCRAHLASFREATSNSWGRRRENMLFSHHVKKVLTLMQVKCRTDRICFSSVCHLWQGDGEQPLHDHLLVLTWQSSPESILSSPGVARAPFLFPPYSPT